jgi:hypothetical protein
MREHFEDAWVEGYEQYIPIIELPDDPDDRHVVATAISCKAQYIVTDNIKHFPSDVLGGFDIESGTADKFLAGTFEHYPPSALEVIRAHRSGLKSKPTAPEYLVNLTAKRLPLLAAYLKPHIHSI